MKVRCNNCMWVGEEADLKRQTDKIDGEPCDGCPTCETDHYLMDLTDAEALAAT